MVGGVGSAESMIALPFLDAGGVEDGEVMVWAGDGMKEIESVPLKRTMDTARATGRTAANALG